MNKCDRCKRELKNPRAKYGPVCAKIMGVDEKYYTDISKKQNAAFREGIAMAQKNLANPFIDGSKVDYMAYAHSMGSYMSALERGDINEAGRELANAQKILNANPAFVSVGNSTSIINGIADKFEDCFIKAVFEEVDTNVVFRRKPIDVNILRILLSDSHYNHNLSLKFGSKHITDQSDKDSVARKAKMGFANFSSNACGWIAAYNALISINEGKHPANIIRYIENNNGLIADGNFGVNPAIYKDLFKYYGLKSSTIYTATNLDKTAQAGRTAILCYFNDKSDITQGAHYINISWDGKQYTAYNTVERIEFFHSIDEFLNKKNRGFIALTVIN